MEEGPEPQEWVERAAEEHHHEPGPGHAHAAEGKRPDHTASAVTAAVLAVMAAVGSLLSGHAANQAILFDAGTGAVTAEVPTGANPDEAIYEPVSKTIWVMNARDGSVERFHRRFQNPSRFEDYL